MQVPTTRARTHTRLAHTLTQIRVTGIRLSSSSSSSTNVYPPIIGPTYIYVFHMNTLFPRSKARAAPSRRASSEYTLLLNSDSNIELDSITGCLPASFRAETKNTKRTKKSRRSDDLALTYRALKNCARKNARALTASNSTQ